MGRLIHKAQYLSAITRADLLVAISEYTAALLAKFYPAAAPKIRVVRIGLGAGGPSGGNPAPVVSATSYFVWIGRDDKRKNAPLVFESYREYLDRSQSSDTLLVVVPKNEAAFFCELASQYSVGARLAVLSNVSEEDKRALLRNSVALLFPSQCEGFGLPILEAMQEGCIPIVYADGPGLELTSNCVPALAELTPSCVCELMVWAKNLKPDAKMRIGRSLQKLAEQFNAATMARELLTVFEEAAADPQASRRPIQFDRKIV
jgi:glycosyltransferase involved in cell wall biosynthesis